MEDFTLEERKYIDMKLKEGEEWQKKNTNKQHTLEEVMDELFSIYKKEKKEYSR